MVQPFQTDSVRWLIQARTSPTFQAVTLSDKRCGLGNVPAFTFRQRVGALNGRGTGVLGRFGLCTSCASRMNALSGSASKTDRVMDFAGLPGIFELAEAIGLCTVLGWNDISRLSVIGTALV